MKENDTYCGFLCSDIIERQQAIIDDIKDFASYNPEFALVMFGRITEMSYNATLELPRKQVEPINHVVAD